MKATLFTGSKASGGQAEIWHDGRMPRTRKARRLVDAYEVAAAFRAGV